jgi:TP901 family phage tail tape measure protein
MAAASQDLLFRFLGVDDGAGAQFDRMAGKARTTSTSLAKFGAGAAVAAGIVAVASVKMAATFQQSTELIHTQAGATQAQVDSYRKSILSLAGATATAPEELSKALFHLASTGVSGAKAIDELRIAAEGAKVGGANLEDVTNALNAVIVSGIGGVHGFSSAMGQLNAIVGTGDMHMQDLADALSTGVLAAIKGFGVTLPQAGAALATFGDNNIRGAQAATMLRMAVNALAKPVVSASGAFAQLGLTGSKALGTFAKDMQTGGLDKALTDLHTRLVQSGNTGARTGQILLDAFGKKAGVGIAILEEEFGRFQTKQDEIKAAAGNFGGAWASTTKNLSFQFDQFRADIDVLAIKIGDALIPAALGAIRGFEDLGKATAGTVGFFEHNRVATLALAGALSAALAPAAIKASAALAVAAYRTLAINVIYARGVVIALADAYKVMGTQAKIAYVEATGGLALIAVAGVEAWTQIRDRSKQATDYANSYVAALKVNTNSTTSISSSTSALQKQIGVFKQFPNSFGVMDSTIKALQAKVPVLTGQFRTASTATRDMGQEFGLTAGQVVTLAAKMGPGELQKPLAQVEKDFQAATQAARDSADGSKIAGGAFSDMGSVATTASNAVNDLSTAFDNLVGNFLNTKQAQLDFKNGMVSLDKALHKSHDSLS